MHDVPYFDRFAPVYDRFMPATDAADLDPGFALADRPIERVLDVGGGTGRVARALDHHAVVVDASAGMLAEARDYGLPVMRGDAGRLPIPDAHVDAVVIVDALHHFSDRDAAVRDAARVLRPGGVLVVRDFNPETLRGRVLAAAEHAIRFDSRFDAPRALADRLGTAGLRAQVVEDGFAFTVAGVKPGEA